MQKLTIFPVTSTPLEKLALRSHFHSFLCFSLSISFKFFTKIPILPVVLVVWISLFDYYISHSSFALMVVVCWKLEDKQSQWRFRPVQDVLRPYLFWLHIHLNSYLTKQNLLLSLLFPPLFLIFLSFLVSSSGLHLIFSNNQEYEEVCLSWVEDEDRLAFLKIICS